MATTSYLRLPVIESETAANKVTTLAEQAALLDRALAGRALITTTGGTVTLTATQATSRLLVVRGEKVTDAVLEIPATGPKLRDYLVLNETNDGTYSVFLRLSSGAAQEVLPNQITHLAHDDTDMYVVS